jgi:protein-L-isoaspartate(D-aspartate) O-methyltransferase
MVAEVDAMYADTQRETGVAAMSPAVRAAMGKVERHRLVPADERHAAYQNRPLSIGSGQTISQPYIVALSTDLLGIDSSSVVLDVGTGSGYQAAVLAELGADVVTIERLPELAEQARANLAAAGYRQVEVRVGDGTLGVPDRAPFDAIAVAAAAPAFPETLYEQLRPRGRLVVPVGGPRAQRLEVIVRSPEGPAVVHSVPCRFVPLVGEEGFAG